MKDDDFDALEFMTVCFLTLVSINEVNLIANFERPLTNLSNKSENFS